MKDTFNLQECAEFLNVSVDSAQKLAAAGVIPGAKICKSWVFLRSDMIHYLRTEIRQQQSERQAHHQVDLELGPAPKVRGRLPTLEELRKLDESTRNRLDKSSSQT